MSDACFGPGRKSLICYCIPIFQGQVQEYTWYIPKTAGPTSEQEECSVGAYYSTVDVNKVGLQYQNVRLQFNMNHGRILTIALE